MSVRKVSKKIILLFLILAPSSTSTTTSSDLLVNLQTALQNAKRDRLIGDFHPNHSPIFRIGFENNYYPSSTLFQRDFSKKTGNFLPLEDASSLYDGRGDEFPSSKSVLFPSMRLLLAVLLCCCYITISISSSNIAVALICMIKCPIHGYAGDLEWHSDQVFLLKTNIIILNRF